MVDILDTDRKNICTQNIIKTKERTTDILDTFQEETDSNGRLILVKTGKISKKNAHRIWALHLAAHIWIYNSKWEVLLQRRSFQKDSYPGLLDISAAWHVDTGENFVSGGLRETKEELGLDVNEDSLKMIGVYREEIRIPVGGQLWHNNELDGVFLLRHEGDINSFNIQESELDGVQFVFIDQLEKEWNDETLQEEYTPKSKEYRDMIIMEVRKALQFSH